MAGGRRSKYKTHVEPKLLLIEAWARDGLTDEQIAKNLDVAYSTFRTYKEDKSALLAALKNGKEVIDTMVENALLKAALGYEYMEEASTKDGIAELKKVAHPNTTALIFWLKNRQPKAWRDKQEVEAINHNMNTDATSLTAEERRERIAELNRKRGIGVDTPS